MTHGIRVRVPLPSARCRACAEGAVFLLGAWFCAVGFLGATAYGQTSSKEIPRCVRTQWTAEDGLPVNSVNDIAQGPDGYLWLTTIDGLVRFDG